MNKQEIFEKITSQLKERLEAGVLPWRKAWKTGIPQNYISKQVYKGINFLSLCLQDFPSPFYLTYLQCKNKNGRINKGAFGTSIIYWDVKEYNSQKETGDSKDSIRIPFLQQSYVFNLAQTDLYQPGEENPVILSC
ncbi:MAG: ArdC family protein [Ignavibacteriaceae bacterium]